MPLLLWIALWSGVTGVVQVWQETVLPMRLRAAKDRRVDHHDRSAH